MVLRRSVEAGAFSLLRAALTDDTAASLAGVASPDGGSLSPLQASSITTSRLPAVVEAPFTCKPPRHPNRVIHFLAEGQESPHPRPRIQTRWQIQDADPGCLNPGLCSCDPLHLGKQVSGATQTTRWFDSPALEVPVSGSWHAVGQVCTA